MPNVIEPAATARSKCRGCGGGIAAGVLRFGEGVPNPFGDGETTHWFHLACAAYKRPEPFLPALEAAPGPIPDAERLKADAAQSIAHPRLQRVNGAERDPSGRAQCRHCKTSIAKGSWRIALVFYEEGRFVPAGSLHPGCAKEYFETAEVMPRIQHFAPGLGEADLQEIGTELQRPTAT